MIKTYINSLDADDFHFLYSSVGWNAPPKPQIKKALENSLYTICIKDSGKPIGMGRLIGDGSMAFTVKDVAVLPSHQRKGIGKMILETMMKYIKECTPQGQHICVELFSGYEKEAFYEQFGFDKKPDGFVGYGMMTLVTGKKI